ncbi:MAG: phenylalanine--tRNA ligase subunit beta [Candidatus Omnitrophota bacterium]
MKVSYSWLKECVNFKATAAELGERLTMAGLEVKSIEKKDNDFIFEIEVTSNRPDWLSIYGIAREIGAILRCDLRPIPVKKIPVKVSDLAKPLITIEDKKGCLRYTGRVIEGVQVKNSPDWLAKKVESAGIRAVNNVVDVTNFCLMETGQPMHAFDYDKLRGGKIAVRKAKKGEEIVTIDGIKRKLDENMLVIADSEKPVAIAGVIGGKDTEVSSSTKKILLESAYFDPLAVRRTAKTLAISTESSYRFERGVDSEGILTASDRAAGLICDLGCAKIVSKISDIGKKTASSRKINIRLSKANKLLGMAIEPSRFRSILVDLGLRVKRKSNDLFEAVVPSFRRDLKEEVDLIEEAARIYGYDKVPETVTKICIWGEGGQKSPDRISEEIIRKTLAGIGLNEVITYALTRKDSYAVKTMNMDENKLLKIQNPLSAESEILRPFLLCGAIDVIARNVNRKVLDVNIFELGKAYFSDKGNIPSEKAVLSIAISGMKVRDWRGKEPLDIFDLKGIVEVLFERLGISDYEFEIKPLPIFLPSASSLIMISEKEAGIFGEIDRGLIGGYDLRNPIFAAELDLDIIFKRAKMERFFSELPRYPSVIRDVSLVVEDKITNREIVDLIKEACGDLAVSVKPFDLYHGEQVPKGSKSILYSVEYRAADRTLTDEEVNGFDKKVREALSARFNAAIR